MGRDVTFGKRRDPGCVLCKYPTHSFSICQCVADEIL